MLISEKMRTIKNLSTSQQIIVDYMLDKKYELENITIEQIANDTFTSPSALIRVSKKFGYNGFVEFKKEYLDELKYLDTHFNGVDANIPFSSNDNLMAIASKIAILEKESIEDTISLIDHDTLYKAINIISNSDTIHYCAVSFTALLGENFALKMSRIGKRVSLVQLESEYLYSSSLINKNDVVIIASYSVGLPIIKSMIDMYKKKGIPIIAITSYGQSYLRDNADVSFTISTREKMYSKIAGYSNETSIKLILDIIYSCYFSLDYENNFNIKKELSKMIENNKQSSIDIIKED